MNDSCIDWGRSFLNYVYSRVVNAQKELEQDLKDLEEYADFFKSIGAKEDTDTHIENTAPDSVVSDTCGEQLCLILNHAHKLMKDNPIDNIQEIIKALYFAKRLREMSNALNILKHINK